MPTVAPPFSGPAPTTPKPIGATFDASLSVPVTGLSPTPTALRSHIEGNIALVWPYSNSTATFSVLLVDHTSRGQVKVVFRGGCAKQVANTKVGIGDKIKLALVGCEWKETVDIISTPGKRLEWDLQFHSRLILQVHPQDRGAILLDYTAPESEPTIPDIETALRSRDSIIEASLNGIVLQKPSTIQVPYLTPSKSARQSSRVTFFDSSFATLADDDGYIVGRGRKRTKFARHSGDWNLIDDDEEVVPDPTSPRGVEADGSISELDVPAELPAEVSPPVVQQQVGDRQASRLDNDAEVQSPPRTPPASSDLPQESFEDVPIEAALGNHVEQKSSVISTTGPHPNAPLQGATVMGPPSTPFKQVHLPQNPEIAFHRTGERDIDRATTPRILPLASPGLPLVSPLIQRGGVEVGYFPIFQESLSQLGASGQDKSDESATDPVVEVSDNEPPASDESLVIVGERASESWEVEERQKSDPASDPRITPSYNHSFRTNDTRDTDQTERSTLSDQWLSTLEASIAQELSNNGQHSPINIESEHTNFNTETYSHPLSNVPTERIHNITATGIMGVETEDLYGAPEDDLARTSELQPQIRQADHGDLHSPSQVSGSEINGSAIFDSNMADISPVDAVEQSVHAQWATEALGLNAAVTASDSISSPSSNQVESTVQIDSLDGNVESREHFHENTESIENQTGTILPHQSSETNVEGQLQDASTHAAHIEPPAEPGADPTSQDLDVQSPEYEQDAAPSVQLPVDQPSASANYTQLPTPDQTQKENYYLDHRLEDVQLEKQITLPSPQPSQEMYKTNVSENEPDREPPLRSPTRIVQHATPSEPKVVAPPRSSQRLSSRNAAISKSISGPFFTPRRSARFSISPSREENIPPPSPHGHTFPSSTNQTTEHQERSTDEIVHPVSSPVLPSAEPLVNRDTGLVTPLAYYPRLSSLNEHFGQLVDVIAICPRPSTKAERAKAGPKDYHTTLHLVDPSCEPHQIPHVLAQVFRPVKKALPTTQAGDIVILHNFKVHTVKRNFALLSSDTSSWAVISFGSNSSEPSVITSGPPLEQGSSEADYASSLSRWWDNNTAMDQTDDILNEGRGVRESSDGPAMRTRFRVKSSPVQPSEAWSSSKARRRRSVMDNPEFSDDQRPISDDDQPQKAGQTRGSTSSPRQSSKALSAARRRRANLTDHFSNEGDSRQVLEDSDRDPTPSPRADRTNKRRESTISTAPSTATQNQDRETTPRRSARLGRSPSVVHELRDGTKYVDEADARGSSVVHELRDGLTYVDE